MKTIMYHYIRHFDKQYPEFRYLDVDKFIEQLNFFEKEWGFLKKEEFLKSVETGISKPGVILTFDDGFKEHYDIVLPILKARGLYGLFYVPTGHYQNAHKELLDVHRIHFLISKCDSSNLYKEVSDNIDSSMLETGRAVQFEGELYNNQTNDEKVLKFKKLMNYYLKYEHKKPILDFLAKKYLIEHEIYDKLYLTTNELSEIEKEGNIVGAHTVSHKVLSRLPVAEQREEIGNSFSFLSKFLKLDVKSFCYPYGTDKTFNSDTVMVLSDLNVHHAFMFSNSESGREIDRYRLERIDCNRFQL